MVVCVLVGFWDICRGVCCVLYGCWGFGLILLFWWLFLNFNLVGCLDDSGRVRILFEGLVNLIICEKVVDLWIYVYDGFIGC